MRIRSIIAGLFLSLLLLQQMVGTALSETLIAFGDSLTELCGPVESVYYDADCGWMNRTEAYPYFLQTYYENDGRDIVVRNFGKGGETTNSGLNRLDTFLDNQCLKDARYILIHEGTNDLFHDPTSQTVVYFNLGKMIDKVRAKGLEPLLATLTPDPDNPWKNIELMNSYIRSLAAEKEVFLVDLHNGLAGNWYEYTHPAGCYGDQLHPNSWGLQNMAAVWYESLADLLKNTSMPWLMLLRGKSINNN